MYIKIKHMKLFKLNILLSFLLKLKVKLFNVKANNLIIIAAMPRSGSNNLKGKLYERLGHSVTVLDDIGISNGIGHQFINYWKLVAQLKIFKKYNIVYGHIPINENNKKILLQFKNVTVIISIRGLAGIANSYLSFINEHKRGPIDWRCKDGVPECCSTYWTFNEEKKVNYIIDCIIPWYLMFLSSWTINNDEFNVTLVKFETQIYEFNKVTKWLFSKFTNELTLVEAHIEESKNLYNVTKMKFKSNYIFNDRQKNKVKNLVNYYTVEFGTYLTDYLNGNNTTRCNIDNDIDII